MCSFFIALSLVLIEFFSIFIFTNTLPNLLYTLSLHDALPIFSDGAVYNIRHPDQAAVGRLTVALAMAASSDPQSLTEPGVLLSFPHVTCLERILSSERNNPG